ncbi:MacS family sensor histidine kinase [Mycolicibacterium frederiksbergense]|uniref:MacS family sensor histidine kinase n=1 Tax=Mycolicibacterium frederiksbergense TaxID=117567 RepID=UPI003999BEB3
MSVHQPVDPAAPLWRAAQVFRLLSWGYAVYFQASKNAELDRPVLGWVLFGVLTVWTLACGVAYLQGFGRRRGWVLAEAAMVVALMASTLLVASEQWVLANQSWPTTLWATNAVVSAAILAGPVAGMGMGLAVMATAAALKGAIAVDLVRSPTILIELSVGLAIGMAANTARRAHAEVERAARLSAALAERERLSRHVHDGVMQVLAMVARRGREIGGETAQLAEAAGEQERALRRLLSAVDVEPDMAAAADGDLGLLLRRHATDRVSVSVPAAAVYLDPVVAAEIEAAMINALTNVERHAGPGARAYVLLEDLGDEVVVSIRDDGPGIPAGRLEAAIGEGRVGVSKSIQGRLAALGGRAELTAPAGGGTEWEFTVPR